MPFDGSQLDDVTKLLIEGRARIERGWTTYAQGRDKDGNEVDPCSETAVAWCAYGALCAAFGDDIPGNHPAAERLMKVGMKGEPWAFFNNRQSSPEPVLDAFDRAIAG